MKKKRRYTALQKKIIFSSLFLLLVGVLLAVVFILQHHHTVRMFLCEEIERSGFTYNEGFSNSFLPGSILQVAEIDSNGLCKKMQRPIVFMSSTDCFPQQKFTCRSFLIPTVRKNQLLKFSLNNRDIANLFPFVNLQSEFVSDYSIELNNIQLCFYAKGKLSGGFSNSCVQAMDRALLNGDKIECYSVVLEVLTTDTLYISIDWKAQTTLEARLAIAQSFSRRSFKKSGSFQSEAEMKVVMVDEKSIILTGSGPMVLGYSARPVQGSYQAE